MRAISPRRAVLPSFAAKRSGRELLFPFLQPDFCPAFARGAQSARRGHFFTSFLRFYAVCGVVS
jgi:hypothetical protein